MAAALPVKLHPQVRAWLAEQTEPCEYCGTPGRAMSAPEALTPGWYRAQPLDATSVTWPLHTADECRRGRAGDASGWANDYLRPRLPLQAENHTNEVRILRTLRGASC